MKIFTVKVFIGNKDPLVEIFFDEKELNVYIEKVYLNKMNRVAIGAGLKKYTPSSGTKLNHYNYEGVSPFARPRDATKVYGKMIDFCKENCYALKIEISSKDEPLLG